MHVFSGFSGLIIYGENIYKDYNRKNIDFVAVWNSKKQQSWGGKRQNKQKNPQKSASERAAAILVYENLLFSCDCAMFFNIGYFISK